jgi:hypothetical protein
MSSQPPNPPPEDWQAPQQQVTQPLPGWDQQSPQQKQPPQWGPPGQQPQPGWGPPPQQPAERRRPWYQRWWATGMAGFLLGAIVGLAGSSNQDRQTATTVTTVVERLVWTTECEKIQNQTERRQCEGIMAGYNKSLQSATTVAPATTQPKATTPAPMYTDGIYEVGAEIQPGTYKTSGGEDCYYARLKSDDPGDIIVNNITSGPQTVRVRPSDKFVEFSGGCTWKRAT